MLIQFPEKSEPGADPFPKGLAAVFLNQSNNCVKNGIVFLEGKVGQQTI